MENSSKSSCCRRCSASPPKESRRGFLTRAGAWILGAFALAVPSAIGIVSALNPLRQKGQGGDFFRVASLDVLPEDGTPRKFPIIADRRDAWTLFPNEPIGSVWLRRVGAKKVKALCIVCPHAGCFIGYDAKSNQFLCPCHLAYFDLDGIRTDASSQSPRDMDALDEPEIRDGKEVWVKFQNFQTGTPDKIAEA
ncbi:MAG: Rieske 2Fe-2S domain-containing protein [Planctomycetia bacterium]|nr:Rieske 2Fe-2S domain-containing protein [Planctomycetia bacterium]